MFSRIREFLYNHMKLAIVVVIVVVLGLFIKGYIVDANIKKQQAEEAERLAEKSKKEEEESTNNNTPESIDLVLLEMQPELEAKYGKVPEGYLWDSDGSLFSLGDRDMTSEEVVYAYLRALQTLDMSGVKKYSRSSKVLNTYEGYFDSSDPDTDYADSFIRKMYKDCLLSIQVEGIQNTSIFTENKQVFTVEASMLDLSSKDFWLDDKLEIYQNLYMYKRTESDSVKSDMYLYDYILNYYESPDAARKKVKFDLTVQKYPDLNTGWLISIDTDVDLACKYTDGNLVISYIMEQYDDEGEDYLEEYNEMLSKEEEKLLKKKAKEEAKEDVDSNVDGASTENSTQE